MLGLLMLAQMTLNTTYASQIPKPVEVVVVKMAEFEQESEKVAKNPPCEDGNGCNRCSQSCPTT
ncbi:MAG: hypothetical protein OHK0017_04130 [Patescibacteria group bacterium]